MEAPQPLFVQHPPRRTLALLPLALLSLALMAWGLTPPKAQKPAQTQESKKVLTPIGEVRVLSKAEARKAVKALKKGALSTRAFSREELRQRRKKGKGGKAPPSGSFLRRLEEVEKIQKVQHESLVPLLSKIIKEDPALAVRSKAAMALLAQAAGPATKAAEKLLAKVELRKQGSVAAPLLKLLSYYGAKQSFWNGIYDKFLDFSAVAQIAICKSIGKRKDWNGLELLLEHLDAPKPIDKEHADNPPESYWKMRWEAWQAFKPELIKSLEILLGKKFTNRESAEAWIQEQGGVRKLRKQQKS
ncbi:MAG: hypothetical protein CSA62_12990 [Planctomycetota bacterium]|nr:MAG: hypothetical protein CSA62_12990 [Planctomycetota bacterium]